MKKESRVNEGKEIFLNVLSEDIINSLKGLLRSYRVNDVHDNIYYQAQLDEVLNIMLRLKLGYSLRIQDDE